MNSQDITRALIDTTVARAMVEMDADPKRSVRKLCDLGRQFSRGRFQNQIFAIFQDLLRNDESPYYQAIDFLLRSNDPEALRQFGINIGYNSFTYGAQILRQKQKELSFAVPWVVKLRLDSRIPDTYDSSFFASVVRTGLTYGIYSYQLRSMDHHEDMESYLAVIQSHPECAFLWFLSDTPLTEKQQKLLLSCPNLMVSLPIDAPSTASMAKALRRQKTLFGMHKVYQDADAAAYLLSFDHLYSQMEQSVFFFLVADDSCSKESIRAVSDVVQQYRFTHSSRSKCRKTPAKLSRLSPPIRRICCFCRITWPAHSIRPPFPLKSCLFGIYFTVNCSQMHKSTAKAEFYFFGSALAAIFSDDLYITSFSSSTNVSGSSSLSMENQRRTAVRKTSQKNSF